MASCIGGHVQNTAAWVWYAQDLKEDADAGPLGSVRRMQEELDVTSMMMVGREGARHPKCFVFLSALTAGLSLSMGAICLQATHSVSVDAVPNCTALLGDGSASSAIDSRLDGVPIDTLAAERWADTVGASGSCARAMLACGALGLLGTYQKAKLVCKMAGQNASTPDVAFVACAVPCARCVYFVSAWIEVVYCVLFLRAYGSFRTLHSDDSEMPWLSITDSYDDCADSDPELHQLARVRLVVVWLLAPVLTCYQLATVVFVLVCCCACVAKVCEDQAKGEAKPMAVPRDSTAISDEEAMLAAAAMGVAVTSAAGASDAAIASGLLSLAAVVADARTSHRKPTVVAANTPGAPTIVEVDGAVSRESSACTTGDEGFDTPPSSPRAQAANP
eukprot:COSAG02_NODE_11992_length_1618_cov_2.497038_2_plen_390_part_00